MEFNDRRDERHIGKTVYVQTTGTLHTDQDCSLAGRRGQSRPSAMTYTEDTSNQVAQGINRWCKKCGANK